MIEDAHLKALTIQQHLEDTYRSIQSGSNPVANLP